MQRLGIQDPTAYLIEKRGEDIRHVVLPATNEYTVKPEIYKDIYVNGLLDPINPKDIDSRSAITNITTKFFARTLPTREVDKAVTPLILIMQRLGIQDPTAYLIEKKV